MNDLTAPTPNPKHLSISLGFNLPKYPDKASTLFPPSVESQGSPFPSINEITMKFACECDTIGMYILTLPDRDSV